jgi:hypothetical protein
VKHNENLVYSSEIKFKYIMYIFYILKYYILFYQILHYTNYIK